MWLLGLCCGDRWSKDELPATVWAKRILIPALVIVPLLLVLRYSVGRGVELGSYEVSFDKWHLGGVRLINFAAIAALLIRFQSVLKPLSIRPLVLMGQASLQVFCAHLLFCFLGLAIMGDAPMVDGWHKTALVTVALSGMLLTAKLFSRNLKSSKQHALEGSHPPGPPVAQFGH
jgi:hypothetical protein